MSLTAIDIFGPDEQHEKRVHAVLENERAKREARRLLDAEEHGAVDLPEILTLRDRLARPSQPVEYRIHGWQPQNTRAILAAQFKAGKTTLTGNLARCLVDGDPFLGRDRVTPIAGTVAILDFEMSQRQLDTWLRDQAIRHDDRVIPIPMRGHAAAFNILEPATRARWAHVLRRLDVAYVVIDCLRPILDALGLDEHREAGRFLVALDALLLDAAIPDALVVHHMGHTGERSRGDSRLRDWPDVEWRLVRQDDDPASPRFITAYGRDVDIPESQVEFDAPTRRLAIAGGSRHDAKSMEALDEVLALLSASPEPMSGRAIKQAMKDSDHARDTIDSALRLGGRTDALNVIQGPRNSKLYSSVRVSGQCPGSVRPDTETFSDASVRVSGPPYRGRTLGRSAHQETDDADRV